MQHYISIIYYLLSMSRGNLRTARRRSPRPLNPPTASFVTIYVTQKNKNKELTKEDGGQIRERVRKREGPTLVRHATAGRSYHSTTSLAVHPDEASRPLLPRDLSIQDRLDTF